MVKSALGKKKAGVGAGESRAGKGFLMKCEGDEGSEESLRQACWALAVPVQGVSTVAGLQW